MERKRQLRRAVHYNVRAHMHSIQWRERVTNSTAQLLSALRLRADSLPPAAAQTSELLRRYATDIEEPNQTDRALVELHSFALDFKGLRDVIVPEVAERESFAFVAEIRRLSTAACRARGLDKSIIGKFRTIASSLFR
jgi:hypothetical protein